MNRAERAIEGHRNAYALITAAMMEDPNVNPELLVAELIKHREDQFFALRDIIGSLAYHAAGALLFVTNGDKDTAMRIVQAQALQIEETPIQEEE